MLEEKDSREMVGHLLGACSDTASGILYLALTIKCKSFSISIERPLSAHVNPNVVVQEIIEDDLQLLFPLGSLCRQQVQDRLSHHNFRIVHIHVFDDDSFAFASLGRSLIICVENGAALSFVV